MMPEPKRDQVSPEPPSAAIAAAPALEQKDEQKQEQSDIEILPDSTGNVESLEISDDDPENPPIVRSKRRTVSIILMLCVRLSILYCAALSGF